MDEKYKRLAKDKKEIFFLQVSKRLRGGGESLEGECAEAFISKRLLDEPEIKENLKGNWS